MLKLRIGEILDERQISTDAFAKSAGISYNTALSLRRGSATRIDLPTLEKVCVYLEITPADLFEYESPKKGKSK